MNNQGNLRRKEGEMTKKIENQTAKVPSDVYLWAALASMGLSASFKCLGHNHTALFIGQWAAPFLLLGIYNKIVKVEGHDKDDDHQNQFINTESGA